MATLKILQDNCAPRVSHLTSSNWLLNFIKCFTFFQEVIAGSIVDDVKSQTAKGRLLVKIVLRRSSSTADSTFRSLWCSSDRWAVNTRIGLLSSIFLNARNSLICLLKALTHNILVVLPTLEEFGNLQRCSMDHSFKQLVKELKNLRRSMIIVSRVTLARLPIHHIYAHLTVDSNDIPTINFPRESDNGHFARSNAFGLCIDALN